MKPLRIYGDYNNFAAAGAIRLNTRGSLRDLTNAGVRLRDGLPLVVYDESDDTEDLEADVIAKYDHSAGVWLGLLGPEGVRDVPRPSRPRDRRFLCLGCRRDLGQGPGADEFGFPHVDECPDCRTPTAAAIAPPNVDDENSMPAT